MEQYNILLVFLMVLGCERICDGEQVILPKPKITRMSIESRVVARLARVEVTTHMRNMESRSVETQFTFQLPEPAFISNFTMNVGGKLIQGVVKEKEEANKIYQDSKKQGLSTATIRQQTNEPGRYMKVFAVNVNLAAESKAVFWLEYHEMLQRKLGMYTQRISFQPNQIVPELTFKAKLYDQEGISHFDFSLPGSEDKYSSSIDNVVIKASDKTREVYFNPSTKYQKGLDPHKGFKGEMVISYDVEHGNNGGIILQQDDFFLHYIAPSGLQVLDKNIVFVIDISGSMNGLKMQQTKNAMLTILRKLHSGDYFNIILFDNKIVEWRSEPMPATEAYINKADDFIKKELIPRGSTNINDALLKSISLLEMTRSLGGTRGNIIVFLTDGLPTAGVTGTKEIRHAVKEANHHRFSLFSLGFGFDVDMPFLKALSWENGGFARRIYAEEDAAGQLESFYMGLQNPTLIDLTVDYLENAVEEQSLTQTFFPQYFEGSEIIIAGKVNKSVPVAWKARVQAEGLQNDLDVVTTPLRYESADARDASVIEKSWAYMKINDLLKKTTITENIQRKSELTSLTLELSLKYNFVTPLTSMVVSETFLSKEIDRVGDESADYHGIMYKKNILPNRRLDLTNQGIVQTGPFKRSKLAPKESFGASENSGINLKESWLVVMLCLSCYQYLYSS